MRDRLSVLWSIAGAAGLAVTLNLVGPQPLAVIRCADHSWWCQILWICDCW